MTENKHIDKKLFVKRLRMACVMNEVGRKELCEKTGISMAALNNVFSCKSVSLKRMNELRRATGFSEIDFIKLTE